MNKLMAFLRLIRWPNLLFIALTQILFYYIVFGSLYTISFKNHILFALLVIASVCIAAAGNIINDYFDYHIDLVNKFDKVIINRYIKRRWAIVLHWALSAIGVALSFYVAYKTKVWIIAPVNLLTVFLLWYYSTTFKRKTLIGNIVIALLTAWVIIVVYFFTGADFLNITQVKFDEKLLFKYMIVYAGFAFIMTLIREAIKDLEDIKGDAMQKCETMPISWGVPATKMYIGVWIVVTVASIIILMVYALQSSWWLIIAYTLPTIVYPLVRIFLKVKPAQDIADYHKLSKQVKWVMFAGILSMIFFAFLH